MGINLRETQFSSLRCCQDLHSKTRIQNIISKLLLHVLQLCNTQFDKKINIYYFNSVSAISMTVLIDLHFFARRQFMVAAMRVLLV